MRALQRFPVMRMRWRNLLFAHWPVSVDALRPLIPSALEIDTFEGLAWVGLVPFMMEDVSPLLVPRMPLHGITDFLECNVRTYVYPRGRAHDPAARGVWFFSLDAASRFAVWGARRHFGLPYFNAKMNQHRDGDVVDYRVQRLFTSSPAGAAACPKSVGQSVLMGGGMSARSLALPLRDQTWRQPGAPSLNCRWRVLEALPRSQPGEIAHFLTERYCLYVMNRGVLHRGRIAHEPWPLRSAELISIDDSLVRAAGIEVDSSRAPQIVHHVDRLDVRAWWITQAE